LQRREAKPWTQEISAIVVGILTIALIASVESLLCAVGVDKLHNGPRTNFNREMIGQGSANVVSDCSGACRSPGSSCAVRPTWPPAAAPGLSAILHGVWVFAVRVAVHQPG